MRGWWRRGAAVHGWSRTGTRGFIRTAILSQEIARRPHENSSRPPGWWAGEPRTGVQLREQGVGFLVSLHGPHAVAAAWGLFPLQVSPRPNAGAQNHEYGLPQCRVNAAVLTGKFTFPRAISPPVYAAATPAIPPTPAPLSARNRRAFPSLQHRAKWPRHFADVLPVEVGAPPDLCHVYTSRHGRPTACRKRNRRTAPW